MKSLLRTLPRLAAALAFAVTTTAAVVLGGVVSAGSAPSTPFSAAPQPAEAAVFIGIGFSNYPRWRWDGYRRSWVHAGFFYGRPGFVANVGYVGYTAPVGPPYWAQPVAYYPHYWHPYYRPAYYANYRHPYYRPAYYANYWHPAYRPAYGGWHEGWHDGWHEGWHDGGRGGWHDGGRGGWHDGGRGGRHEGWHGGGWRR